jgi:hypothetical protein
MRALLITHDFIFHENFHNDFYQYSKEKACNVITYSDKNVQNVKKSLLSSI